MGVGWGIVCEKVGRGNCCGDVRHGNSPLLERKGDCLEVEGLSAEQLVW